jgi:hypothetical protein
MSRDASGWFHVNRLIATRDAGQQNNECHCGNQSARFNIGNLIQEEHESLLHTTVIFFWAAYHLTSN